MVIFVWLELLRQMLAAWNERSPPKTRFPKAPRPLAGWFGGAEPLHEAPTNQTISPRKNPSAGSGTHFLGRSDRLMGATE